MAKQTDLLPTYPTREWGLMPFSESTSLLSPRGLLAASPFQIARRIQEDVDRLWSEFAAPTAMPTEPAVWAPNVDIIEEPQQWRVDVDLPGVKRDDINVDVRDHQLIIRAELKREEKEEKTQYTRRERRYGVFERRLTLPDNAKVDAITSTYENGILTCLIPKTEESQKEARHIPVS